MQIQLKGVKGRIMAFLFLPMILESSLVVLLCMTWMKMSVEVAYTFVFTMAPVSTSVILLCMLAMIEKGYGTHKRLPQTLIPALVLDDTLSLCLHQILLQLALNNHPENNDFKPIGTLVFQIFLQLLGGAALSLLAFVLFYIKNPT